MATAPTPTLKNVNIRPEVSVLSVFPHLNYKPWYAIAEFVDNAVQSFLTHKEALEAIEGTDFTLTIDIELDPADGGHITVRDNAAGISTTDYQRAFKPASVPPDRSGLSEFGVGMKSAACWFTNHWSVRTSALGENIERFISFDVESIVQKLQEEIAPIESPVSSQTHFTEVVLSNVHAMPKGRTIGKIKDHLASIYRIFLRTDAIIIRFNGEKLSYKMPDVLTASYYKDDTLSPQQWAKKIDLDFGNGRRIWGIAALLAKASTSGAGFALFRRKRLILGSGDEGYRPEQIFRKSNSYTYQRLFGELHVEGFSVSHTKDGFQWDELEESILEQLKIQLNAPPLPLLDQAEGYRARLRPADLQKGAQTALDSTAKIIERDVTSMLDQYLHLQEQEEQDDFAEEQVIGKELEELPPTTGSATKKPMKRIIEAHTDEGHWKIAIEFTTDPAISDWLSIGNHPPILADNGDGATRQIDIRLSLAHPFMSRFGGTQPDQIEPLLRIAAALALAEVVAREGGLKKAGTIRRYLNDLLRHALAKA
jgi:hypothetical protein